MNRKASDSDEERSKLSSDFRRRLKSNPVPPKRIPKQAILEVQRELYAFHAESSPTGLFMLSPGVRANGETDKQQAQARALAWG